MHLTLAQSISAISTVAAAWLMVRAGTAKGALRVKEPSRCAACGRRQVRGRCLCASGR
jgi:hypothetical protein